MWFGRRILRTPPDPVNLRRPARPPEDPAPLSSPRTTPGERAVAERDVYSIGRLNREVRMLLEHGMPAVWVEGEISNFSRPASGHWYFTLKDREGQIRCAMFRGRNALLRVAPADGQRVIARGRVTL